MFCVPNRKRLGYGKKEAPVAALSDRPPDPSVQPRWCHSEDVLKEIGCPGGL